jgi:hypothetical protein
MHVLYFISWFCVAPAMLAPLFIPRADVPGYQLVPSYAFAEKHFKNLACWLDSQRV